MKLFFITSFFFLFTSFSPSSSDSLSEPVSTSADTFVVDLDTEALSNCNPIVSMSSNDNTPPGFCNTCQGSCVKCSGNGACRGVLVTVTVNGSSTLPPNWGVQWSTPPNSLCFINGSTTLEPIFAFNVCNVPSPGGGTQTVPVTVILFPPACPPVIRTLNVTYSVC